MIGRCEVCAKQPSDGRLLPGERRRRIVYGGLQTLSQQPPQSIDVRRPESLCQAVYRMLCPIWNRF